MKDNSSPATTGLIIDFAGTATPSGWLLCSGRTIGNAASSATERANADTQALFTLLWNSLDNTRAPVSGGRGASALADFNANKTIQLPDLRGRITVGKDNMGGTAANVLTSTYTMDATILGNSADREGVSLPDGGGRVPNHTHTVSFAGSTTSLNHAHTVQADVYGGGEPESVLGNRWGQMNNGGAAETRTFDSTSIPHTHSITISNAGSGTAHNNVQPTIILNKIIKL